MSTQPTSEETITRSPEVLSSDFEDGIMMMDIEGGTYFQADAVGARVWALLEEPRSLDALCAALAREYRVDMATCRADVGVFVDRLREAGLVAVG